METLKFLEMVCNAQDDCEKCVFRVLDNEVIYQLYHCRYALGETNDYNVALNKLALKINEGYRPKIKH